MNDGYITFFVSTDAHDRMIRRMWKKIGQCRGGIFALSMLTCILFAAAVEQGQKIIELEERLNKKDETAG